MIYPADSAIQRLNNRGQDITIRRVSVTPGTGPRILDRKTSQSKFVFPTIQRSVKFRDFVDFKICSVSSVVSSLNFYVKFFYFKAFFPACRCIFAHFLLFIKSWEKKKTDRRLPTKRGLTVSSSRLIIINHSGRGAPQLRKFGNPLSEKFLVITRPSTRLSALKGNQCVMSKFLKSVGACNLCLTW